MDALYCYRVVSKTEVRIQNSESRINSTREHAFLQYGDPHMMKNLWIIVTTAAMLFSTGTAAAKQLQPSSYTASWTSLNQHPAAPEWFQDAKFGIYYHWGVYSVPAHYSEWYPYYMFNTSATGSQPGASTNGADSYTFHVNTYGDPFTTWGYDKFMSGANDKKGNFVQFAPKLVSSGGNWDPDAWAKLFVNAGARFAGPSIEHHDGFSMWDSKANPWNSVGYGPKLNMAKLEVDAYRKVGLKIVTAFHHAYHFQGYYQSVPKQTDSLLKILYAQTVTANENDLWLAKLKEVIDEFQPDILWQDASLAGIEPTHLLQSLTYYYNAALGWDKEVVATYKDGYNNQGEVFDYERGGPSGITTPYWMTDDAVGVSTWGYTTTITYNSAQAVVDAFIDRVSKGGNLLLNISPMADGTIPQAQQDILNTMGAFLKQNGTAIYSTRAWSVYGEGPTKMGGLPSAGTSNDVRYTKSKDGTTLYAVWMGWPGNGKQVTMASVTTTAFPVGSGKVFLFGPVGGSAIELPFTQDKSGLHVTFPTPQPYSAAAYALEVSPAGTPPAPTPWLPDQVKVMEPAGETNVAAAKPIVRFYNDRIEYQLPKTTNVTIRIFTIKGSFITIIADSRQEAGRHRLSLLPRAVAAGRYVLSFKAGDVENRMVVPVM